MLGRTGICLAAMALILLSLSCARLPEPPTPGKGDIAIEKLSDVDSIPSKWGNLQSVSNHPDFAHVLQLWFQDEHGNIRLVFYNMNTNQLLPQAMLIRRK